MQSFGQSESTKSTFPLWIALSAVFLLLLKDEKKTPDMKGLIRTCDGWFPTTDKRGKTVHRCFIYKPTCSPKKCKTDPNVSRETNPEIQGIMGIEDMSDAEIKRFKEQFFTFRNYDDLLKALSISKHEGNQSAKKVLDKMRTQIFEIKDDMKYMSPERKKYYVGLASYIQDKIDLIPEELEKLTFKEIYNIAKEREFKPFEAKEQLKLFGMYDLPIPDTPIGYRAKHYKTAEKFADSFINMTYANKTFGQLFIDPSFYLDLRDSTLKDYWNYVHGIRQAKKYKQPEQLSLFSGYTATCLKFGRNRLGHRQCLKYSPTCGSADEGCRMADDPAPLPDEVGKRTQRDKEIEADALAQALADDANFDLDQNKQLMRTILDYGGIAPHRGGFLSEEYAEIPTKYKRKTGIPMDELAQELGTDESALTDRIYAAEGQFRYLKDLRGGKTARRFKKDDFVDEAWSRLASGRGFFGQLMILKSNPAYLV